MEKSQKWPVTCMHGAREIRPEVLAAVVSLLTLVFLLLVGDSQVDVLLWKVKVRKWNWPELEHVRAWVGSQAGRAHTCNKMLLCT